MKAERILIASIAVLVVVVFATPDALAIPAFARKYNLACSSCHSAVPYLNPTGRTFKEAGYRMPDEDGEIDWDAQPSQTISQALSFDRTFPIAARIKGYIVDDQSNSETKIRPLHEVEIFSAGSFWKNGSWFFEVEGEDEADFETALAGTFGWHPRRTANFNLGFGSIVHQDPYNSLQDGGHRLTVSHKIPLDVGSSVGARLRNDAQFISFYGRSNQVYYSLSYSSGNGNPEGENPNDVLARVAWDFTPDLMVGGFVFDGRRESSGGDIDLQRVGFDFNLAFDNTYLVGMFMEADEDPGAGLDQSNTAGYVEAFYTWKKDDRPYFVPLLRYDWTELNDGDDKLAAMTAQVGWYFVENMKLAVEYYDEFDVAPGKTKKDRLTLLADLSF